MKRFFLYALLFATVPCTAQTVNIFESGMNEGVTYSLPDTQLDITVEAECITRTPGEFCRYAERFLRISDAITSESKEWELTRVLVKSNGIPNSKKTYTVALGDNPINSLVLTDKGILSAINRKPIETESKETKREPRQRVNASKYFTEEILQATSTAKMAELVAKEIYAIRESKLTITRGTADNLPQDGESMHLVLNELDLQERTLTELFTGHTDTIKYTCNIKFTPSVESDTTRSVLFRFSHKLGILERDNLAGAPIYYDFKNLKTVKIEPVDDKKKKKEIKKEGICYSLPGKALVKVYTASETLFEAEIPFAQLGTVEVLSRKFFDKNGSTKVLFDTVTGGIIEIEK